IHPHYVEVLETYLNAQPDTELIRPPLPSPLTRGEEGNASAFREGGVHTNAACIIIQSPNFHGECEDINAWRKICDETGALLIVVINEILSLGLLPAPECADIVCGEAQSIGLPMSFGGPHLGFFACNEKFIRQMMGCLCG